MSTERSLFSFCSSPCIPLNAVSPRASTQRPRQPSDAARCHDSTSKTKSRPMSVSASQRQRRRNTRRRWLAVQSWLFVMLLCILSKGAAASVHDVYYASPMDDRSELIFDRSLPPARPMRLVARQETTTSLPSSIQSPTNTQASGSSDTASTAASIATATPTGFDALPTAFDTSLGNNFTAPSCPAFFHSFLSNSTFKACMPFSLLLQTSNGFFAAEQSLFRLTQTLDATCSVDFAQCASTMASLAQQIQLSSNCGQDLEMQNPMVLQAYNGLIAYQPLYHAGCLTDTQGNYCFANAVTNSSAPTSSYIYYLPLGVQLPAGTQPACSTCLQNTMAVFDSAASNSSMPLSDDYDSAAQQVDSTCGSSFVQASVRQTSAAAASMGQTSWVGLASLLVMIVTIYV